MIEIQLNGASKQLSSPVSLLALTQSLALDLKQVAIEHNRQIITRSKLDDVTLKSGDNVEIVEFIGGG